MTEFKSPEGKHDNKESNRERNTGVKALQKAGDFRRRLAGMGYEKAAQELSPSSAGVVQKKQKHSDLNSMKPGSQAAKAPLPDLKGLEKLGYVIYPASSLDVLNSAAKEDPSKSLRGQKTGQGGYDAVVSGTFYSGKTPVGAVMRNGKMETAGADKAKNRGGVAVLEDGTIVVKRMQGNRKEDIEKAYGGENNNVKDFMGGGALLIEDGKKVSSDDLHKKQKFDQGGKGLNAAQMRKTDHIVIGIRDGKSFVIVAKGKSGAQIQNDLFKFGFDSVIKYDGGSGAFAKDAKGVKTGGSNPTGFGVR